MINRIFLLTTFVRFFRNYRYRSMQNRIVKMHNLQHFKSDDWCRSELRARDLLCRAEKAVSWVPVPLYPVGGAAGPLLLYLLIRILDEMPVKNILELGAGQSTRLLDAWAQENQGHVVTFEHDKLWADTVSSSINQNSTQVLHLPLVEMDTDRGKVNWYACPSDGVLPESGFDLVLVDGPVGSKNLSRYGIVEKVPELMGKEWVIVWDDLDRLSDLQSFAFFIEKLRANGLKHNHILLDGDRTVGIVYTEKYNAARFLW